MKLRDISLCALPLIALFFYSTPWLIAATRFTLGLYLLSFLWFFLIAWIMCIVCLYKAIKYKAKKVDLWKPYGLIVGFILIGYVGLFIGFANGYLVTV